MKRLGPALQVVTVLVAMAGEKNICTCKSTMHNACSPFDKHVCFRYIIWYCGLDRWVSGPQAQKMVPKGPSL